MPPRPVWLVVVLLLPAALVGGLLLMAASTPEQSNEETYLYSLIEKNGKLDFSLGELSLPAGSDESLARAIAKVLGPKVCRCTLFTEGVCGNKLLRPCLKCADEFGDFHSVARAHEGGLRIKGEQATLAIHFTDGEIVFADGRRVDFEDKTWFLPLPAPLRKQ